MLEFRGTSPRNYKNAIIFLAADANRLKELEQATRQWLAWESIWKEREALNLDPFQTKQAETKRQTADDTVEARIPETYHWLLVPGQPDPKGPMEWADIRLQGQDALAARASKKMKNDMLLLTQMGGNTLRLELDRIPLWRGDHVSLKLLADDMAKYPYLPRLRDQQVLLLAVRDGLNRLTWRTETFAYAERYDDAKKRYMGLQHGAAGQILVDGQTVLVKPDVASAQIEADQKAAAAAVGTGSATTTTNNESNGGKTTTTVSGGTNPTAGAGGTAVISPPKLRRFHGTVDIDTLRLGRDAGRIAEEVVQHLSTLPGVTVKVTLEIEADIPQGASDDLVRTITENCRTLRFKSQGFEES
jgi:hypothetical protein